MVLTTLHTCNVCKCTHVTWLICTRQFRQLATVGKVIGAAVVALLGIKCCVKVINAGEVGLVDLFGTVSEDTLKAGIHVVNPLSKVHSFSIKTQNVDMSARVPTNEGLNVEVDMSVLFRLDPEQVRDLYMKVGKDFVNVVLQPTARAVLRNTVAMHEAKSLYTSGRAVIGTQIIENMTTALACRGIVTEDVLMRSIALPINVSKARQLPAAAPCPPVLPLPQRKNPY